VENKNTLKADSSLEVIDAEIIENDEKIKPYPKAIQHKTSLANKVGQVMGTIISIVGLFSEIKSFFPFTNSNIDQFPKNGKKKRRRFRSGK